MKRFVAGLLMGAMMVATSAIAYEVVFPRRLRPQAMAMIDELGAVLFGMHPGRIEVTNWPTPEPCPGSDDGTPWRAHLTVEENNSYVVTTVPAGFSLHITDMIVASGVYNVSHRTVLTENSVEVASVWHTGVFSTSVGWSSNPTVHLSPSSALVFFENAEVGIIHSDTTARFSSSDVTLIGRLVANPV